MDRKALHSISYGLYIVSSRMDGKLNGQIANTVVQLASDPPMVGVCLNKQNLTHEYVEASKVFSVSVLSTETPMKFIGLFGFRSGRGTDKFEGINHRIGITGAPIVLDYAVAYMEAEVLGSISAATHTLFTAKVVDAEILDSEAVPMTYEYYRQVKRGKSPKTAPTYIAEEPEKETPRAAVAAVEKWRCLVCGYIYDPAVGDPDGGIEPGTAFEDIPDDWVCPVCGAGKDEFEPVE